MNKEVKKNEKTNEKDTNNETRKIITCRMCG